MLLTNWLKSLCSDRRNSLYRKSKRRSLRQNGGSGQQVEARSAVPTEVLEDRALLANFTPGDVATLIANINSANNNNQNDVIDLGGMTFTLDQIDNDPDGAGDEDPNGLPQIGGDGGRSLTIRNGTIERDTVNAQDFRILDILAGAEVTLENSTITGGSAARIGAGIRNAGDLTIIGSLITQNRSFSRGAIWNSGELTVENSTASANRSYEVILNRGTVTITNSSITGNNGHGLVNRGTATITGTTVSENSGVRGHGIVSLSPGTNAVTALTVVNSTISGNSGHGILIDAFPLDGSDAAAITAITNSTIAENARYGIRNNSQNPITTGGTGSSHLTLTNSIVTRSTGSPSPLVTSLGNSTISGSNNVIYYPDTHPSDALFPASAMPDTIFANPLLGPLADNGGPTLTHALQQGSPAIDAGDNALATDGGTSLTTDQRGTGFNRRKDGNNSGTATVDAGAFESPPDTIGPTVSVDIVDALLSDSDNRSFMTFEFSEPVAGFDETDLTVEGGTLSALNMVDSDSYTATFTANDDVESTGSVSVNANSYTDLATNLGASGSGTVTIDTLKPTLLVSILDSSLNDGDNSSDVTFEFSEPVAGFDEADVNVAGGTLSAFNMIDSDSYTATFTANDDLESTGSVSVNASRYRDLATNGGASGSGTVTIDTLNPTLLVSILDSSLNDGDNSSDVTFEFSEPVAGFDEADVNVAGGTLSAFNMIDSDSYTATFTANDDLESTGSVSVDASRYRDLDDNSNEGTASDTVTIDTVIPTVIVNIADSSLNDGDNSSDVTFEFSEPVTGFNEADVTVAGGMLSAVNMVDSDSYTATFTANDGAETAGSVTVNADSYTDLATNAGATASDTVTIDTLNPTVTVNIVDSSLNDGDNSSNVTFEFSEPVTDFEHADVTVAGGTLSALNMVDTDSYTATFTANDGAETAGSVTVNADSYTDLATNAGATASDTVTIDTLNPTVTVNIVDSSLNDGDNSSNVTFEFSEPVTDFEHADVTVAGGTLSALNMVDTDSYTATFIANDGAETTGTVSVVVSSYMDPTGNDGTAGSDTVTIDTLNPTVTSIVRQAPTDEVTNSDTPTFRVTFSENVTGVGASDFAISGAGSTGGAINSVSMVNGAIYNVQITGVDNTNGLLDLDFAGGQNIADVAGNMLDSGTIGSEETYTLANDVTAPTAAITRDDANPSNAGSVVFSLDFSEDVSGVDATDFEVATTDSATANATVVVDDAGDSDDSTYTVTINGVNGDGTVGLDFAAATNIADAAGNPLNQTPTTDETYTVDNTVPTLAITRSGGEFATGSVTFILDFSEDVTDVDVGDFGAIRIGTQFAGFQFGDAGDSDDSTYTLTFSGLTGEGTLGLELVSNTDIADLAGNVLNQTLTSDEIFTISDTPFLVSNTNDDGFGSLRYAVKFANDIAGADTIQFSDGTDGTHPFDDATPDTISLTGGLIRIEDDLTLVGAGPDLLTIDGGGNSRIFNIRPGNHDITLEHLRIINANTVQDGGGVINQSSGTVVIDQVSFQNNIAGNGGGAISNSGGSLTVRNSTFSGNNATGGAGGGAILNTANLTVVNSTLSGNTTDGSSGGGGILNISGTVNVVNSTIALNDASVADGGGGVRLFTGVLSIDNSIVSGNTSPGSDTVDNIDGSFTGSNNLIDIDVATIIDTTLQDNGGLTETHAVIADSVAIDTGSNATASGANLTTDQRGTGFGRINGGTVDIGALESEALASPPQAPENVIAADTETLRPTISWDAEPNATSYGIWFIKLAEGATPGSVVAGLSGLTSLSFTPDADLAEGNYSVWVRSINAAGASTWSIPATFRIGPMVTIPAAPASVTVVDATVARPTIEWTPSADATSYGIWFIDLAGGVVAGESGLTGTSFTPSADLVAGNEYRVYVRAINSAGVGDWSTPLDFRSGPIVATPDAPLAVTVIDTETLRPTIQWDAAATATSYGIWFINLAGGVVAGQSGLTGLSFTPSTDLVAGDEYRVYVRSINSAGPSDWSAPVTFRVGPMETIPGPPQNVTAIDIETAVPTIQWDAVANASSYGIWFVNLAGGVVAGESGLTSTSFTSPTALDGNYRVWIRSFNAAGVSDWSTPLDITVTTVDMELTLEDGPAHGDLQLLEVELLESRNLAGVPEFRGNPNAHPHSHRRTQPPRLGQDQAQPSDRGVRIVERQHESNAAVVEWARRSTAADRANQKADLSHEAEDSDLLFPFLAAANTWSAETTGTM